MSRKVPDYEKGPPRGAKGGFPYPGHWNMEEIMIQELEGQERRRALDRRYYRQHYKSWRRD